MFDSDKAKELERQSHVRGMLSKEFYSGEQSDLEKKRKQMKRILDEQVEERRRVKEEEKMKKERALKEEEESIKRYYEEVMHRERKVSENHTNNSGAYARPEASRGRQLSKNDSQLNRDPNQSRVKKYHDQHLNTVDKKQRSKPSKPSSFPTSTEMIEGADMPLLTLMNSSEGSFQQYGNNSGSRSNFHSKQQQQYQFENQNAGNIPLLDLAEESKFLKGKKKSKVQLNSNPNNGSHREKSDRESHVYGNDSTPQMSPPHHNSSAQPHYNSNFPQRHQRQKTFGSQDNGNASTVQQHLEHQQSFNSRVSLQQQQGYSQNHSNSKNKKQHPSTAYQQQLNRSPSMSNRMPYGQNYEEEIEEIVENIQKENKQLKSELKKSQEAISLLIGAVRSNAKLDKFRVKAEKILHSENESKVSNFPNTMAKDNSSENRKSESPLLLPKLKLNHQSIMHDYMLSAAKKKLKNALKTK